MQNPFYFRSAPLRLLLVFVLALAGASSCVAALPSGPASFTTSDGVALYARVAGQGPACVFVPGGPGAGCEIVETLAGPMLEHSFQMVYCDPRGSGRSASAPANSYGLDRLVLDLEELRQQLHLERWTLMSHSFGGLVATAYAARYPARVQGLVLANSILHLPASMESFAAAGYALLPVATRPPLDPAMPLPQRLGMVSALLQQQHLLNKLMYATDSAAARVARFKPARPANHDLAVALYQPGLIDAYLQDFTALSARITAPVLVLPGLHDDITGPTHYQTFRFPHQQVVVMPGKHYAFFDSPQEFGRALQQFARQL